MTFAEVPRRVELVDLTSGNTEIATIDPLDREMAKKISSGWSECEWWAIADHFVTPCQTQPDHHWDWVALVSRVRSRPLWRSVCLRTSEGTIQGAMLYEFGRKSAIDPQEKAVHVDRIATAPHNRPDLVASPRFRGVGAALLRFALAESWAYGLRGRANLFPVSNLEFYTRRGFRPTTVTSPDGLDILHEISESDAEALLRQHGTLS